MKRDSTAAYHEQDDTAYLTTPDDGERGRPHGWAILAAKPLFEAGIQRRERSEAGLHGTRTRYRRAGMPPAAR